MRSLLKANGKTLVIQKVLPALFQQTYDKFKDVLGELYGTAVYALRFNLKMRLSRQEIKEELNAEGQMEEKNHRGYWKFRENTDAVYAGHRKPDRQAA